MAQLPTEGTILEALDIDIVEATPDRVELVMPVGPKVHQPMGLLHGGASAVMAETAGSIGAYLNCDPATEYAVGIELNISHLRARSEGTVRAVATPVRKGRAIHVWTIDITDQDGVEVATSRATLAIRPLKG
ncbi:MAG: PaaI family thioesterase [Actinomycetota bacterium]|jgi:1,4-dihydroxy-2-naphthoyl-CoA hydrolase